MMSISHIALLFFALLFPLAINAQIAETTKETFAQIKQIYVEDDASGTPKEKSLKLFLQTELAKQWFIFLTRLPSPS
jgi:hypothetical protein